MSRNFDLRDAINAVSDVVMNRPRPIREFDQIYMKVADMVIQAHFVAERFQNKNVVFIGDGDAIGLAVMHLRHLNIFKNSPQSITLLDFDERIVNSVNRFADQYGFAERISAYLYNVIDSLPKEHTDFYDAFYTNPPWGASNKGESVLVFLQRGIEATNNNAMGAIVIADDYSLPWTQAVLASSQKFAADEGLLVAEMIPEMHLYHLDDAPNLRSCTCVFRRYQNKPFNKISKPLAQDRLINFYGKNNPLHCRYVREKYTPNYGKASDDSYQIESIRETL